MSTLFKKPDPPAGITFMLRGAPGSGKTRFALGLKRVTGLPVAYIGTDRGASFYRDDAEVGGFLQVETRDSKTINGAIAELREDNGASFGAAVVDTVTDMWNAEQKDFEIIAKDGKPQIPIRAWRPMRDAHEHKLRDLQALPMHTVLICEEKPIFEKKVLKDGEVELVEVGSKEDADKKDSYVCDVRLRFFVDGGAFFAEVLKDRTGTFAMGSFVENPRVEMWVKSRVTPKPKPAPVAAPAQAEPPEDDGDGPDAHADRLIERINALENKPALAAWTKKHAAEINGLPADAKARVVAAGTARKATLANGSSSHAGAES